MKKISLLLILAVTLVACNYHDPNDGDFQASPSSGWVDFNDSLYIADSTTDTITVPVTLNAPVNEEGLTVTVAANISGSATNTDIGPLTATFPPGKLTGNIIVPVDRDLGDYDIDLEITGTSRDEVSVGLDDAAMKITMATANICGALTGEYDGVSVALGTTVNFETVVIFSGNISDVEGNCVYESNDLWGTNLVAELAGDPSLDIPYPGMIIVNPNDNSVIVTTETNNPGGSGTYDPETGVINLTLEQAVFSDDFTVDVTLSPMPQ